MRLLRITPLALLVALCASPAYCWMSPAICGGGVAAGTSNFCDGYSGLACEDFEGEATCGDDESSQANCRESWTGDANGTEDNQVTGLAGTYAKQLDDASASNTTGGITYTSFTDANSAYAFALLKFTTLSMTANAPEVLLLRGTTAMCLLSVVGAAGPAPYFKLYSTGGTLSDTGYGTISANTVYAIWLEYNNNTANTGCSVYITTATCSGGSCSATKPSLTKGLSTNNSGAVNMLKLGSLDQVSFGDADPMIVDNIKVSNSALGNDGQ